MGDFFVGCVAHAVVCTALVLAVDQALFMMNSIYAGNFTVFK